MAGDREPRAVRVTIFNQNYSLAQLGYNAASQYGNAASGLYTNQGNANAGATIGQGNAWSGALGQIGNNATNYGYFNAMQQPRQGLYFNIPS